MKEPTTLIYVNQKSIQVVARAWAFLRSRSRFVQISCCANSKRPMAVSLDLGFNNELVEENEFKDGVSKQWHDLESGEFDSLEILFKKYPKLQKLRYRCSQMDWDGSQHSNGIRINRLSDADLLDSEQ